MKILIKGAKIVNPDKIIEADLFIQNGKIGKIGKNISLKADKEIEAKGKHVFPGFIDLHAHLRSPGREDEEDLLSGSRAAIKGGFTTIFCMPNTEPALDNEGLAKWIVEEGQRIGLLNIYPVGAITKNREGKELTEFGALKKSGCLFLSDDGDSVSDALILRRALEYAKMFNLFISCHCEDKKLSNGGSMRESFISSKYGILSIPDICESLIVARDIEIAKYLGVKLHLAHISSAKSIEIIKKAKKDGSNITAETCPHYFSLSLEEIENSNFDSNLKVNPPLGTNKDLAAIKKALGEGIIDCIATDHAPHSAAEKELPFEDAPFGMIGLELAFSLANTYLVKEGVIGLTDLTSKLSSNPAKICGLKEHGQIKEGYPADLNIIDIDKTWQVNLDTIVSKSSNTPFLNRGLKGVVEYTIYRGKIVYRNNSL